LRRADLRLADGARGFDIDDYAMIRVDQIIGRVGEEGGSLALRRPL
jgi:hypothetical protein